MKRVETIAKALAIATLILLTIGCAATRIPARVNYQMVGQFNQAQSIIITDGLFRAFTGFLNCQYLTNNHPHEWRRIVQLRLDIKVDATNNVEAWKQYQKVICGSAPVGRGNTITLNVDMFDDKGCDMRETIAHEMLHLAGLNHEENKGEPLYEEFSKTLFKCGLSRVR